MAEHKIAKIITDNGQVVEGKVISESKSGTGTGGVIGAAVGMLAGDPTGMLLGGAIGAMMGSDKKASATVRGSDGREVTGEVVQGSRKTINTES